MRHYARAARDGMGKIKAYVRINDDGLRDRAHTKEKPANTFRIAVLGDSYAERSHAAIFHIATRRAGPRPLILTVCPLSFTAVLVCQAAIWRD